MDLRDGDTVFYDQIYDVLMPDRGWMLTNETDGLFVTDSGFIIGARYTFSKPFYEARNEGGPNTPTNEVQRVGPLLAYVLDSSIGGRFERPTILLLTQWHIRHRWRTGADVDRAVPHVGLGFTIRGTLWE